MNSKRNGNFPRKPDGATTSDAFRRLAIVEEEVGDIRETLAKFSTQLKHVDDTLMSVNKGLSNLSGTVQARSVTDWKTLAAWAGVILSLVILYTNLNLSPVNERQLDIRRDIDELQAQSGRIDAARFTLFNSQVELAESLGRYKEKVDQLERRSAP